MKFLNGGIFIILSFIYLITPYKRGLFFDTDFYIWQSIIGLLFMIYAAWHVIKKNDSITLGSLIVFMLPLMYVLAIPVAESPKGNMEQIFRWVTYASFFVLLFSMKRQDSKIRKAMPFVFYMTGFWIAFFGLFALWGFVEFKDAMLGERMTSIMQYHNTFAALISAVWLFGLIKLTDKQLSIWSVVFFTIPLTAFGVGLLHSYSRGSLLVFMLAWFIGLLLLKARNQVIYIVYSIMAGCAALITFRAITMGEAEKAGLTTFWIATIVTVLLAYVIHTYMSDLKILNKIEEKGSFRFIAPAITLVGGILLLLDILNKGLFFRMLPVSFQNRLEGINLETASVEGRFRFFDQAIEMSKDSPLLGYGGDGWRILFTKYQEVPFWSNEVHNFYLESLLSIGIIGLFLFVVVLVFLMYQLWGSYRNSFEGNKLEVIGVIISLLMLFIHAGLDFDFSYGVIGLTVMFLFALGMPDVMKYPRRINNKMIYFIASGIVIFFVLLSSIYSFRFHQASQLTSKINYISFTEAKDIFTKANKYNPYDITYSMELAKLYQQAYTQKKQDEFKQIIVDHLKNAYLLEPNNPVLLYEIARIYSDIDEKEKAIEFYNLALSQDRFNSMFYYVTIAEKSQFALAQMVNGQNENGRALAKSAIHDYEKYIQIVNEFKNQDIPDKRNLEIQKEVEFYVAQSYFITGDSKKVVNATKGLSITGDKELEGRLIAMRVLSLEELGRRDEARRLLVENEMVRNYIGFYRQVK